jgi:flagellar M-ring protein FliF
MSWSTYWRALTQVQRIGLVAGAAIIIAAMLGLALWVLHDPYVSLAGNLSGERFTELAQALERARIPYRVGDNSDALEVPRSQLAHARVAAAGDAVSVAPSVGLEIFNEADFSANDFAQRINYQRALQGELTRTIQTVEGVRSARVHVVLADEGLFKRDTGKASAAVTLAMQPGKVLTRAQVRGIQRLVAASIPQIRIDDVVVLDDSGLGLSRAGADGDGDLSSAQLDAKRQADQYFEQKLTRLLQEIVPQSIVSVSVDTTLDHKQVKVTSEEPIAVRDTHVAGPAAGVLVRERETQHGRGAGLVPASEDASVDNFEREYEYKVGQRIEQALSTPGSIERISVAVAIQGAPAELDGGAIEKLVSHAVGIDQGRGDSLSVMLMPRAAPTLSATSPPLENRGAVSVKDRELRRVSTRTEVLSFPPIVVALAVAAVLALLFFLLRGMQRRAAAPSDAEVDALAAKVRQWLNDGAKRGHA